MLSPVGVDTAVIGLSVGAVVSITKGLTSKLLLVLPVMSVTVMMQLLWGPSASSLNVIELLSAKAVSLSLSQPPEYVISPASSE